MECFFSIGPSLEITPSTKNNYLLVENFHNFLPYRVVLNYKHIKTSLNCSFYEEHEEFVNHILLQCEFAQAIWFNALISL